MPDFALKGEIVNAVRWLLPPLGLAAIFTSVMVYHDTMRSLWRINRGGGALLQYYSAFYAAGV